MHAGNGDHPLEVYRFLRDEVGTQFIQLIPIVERATPEILPLANLGWGGAVHTRPLYTLDGNVVTERSIKSEQWGEFLIRIFDEWVRRDAGTVFVNMFDAALASWVGVPPALCVFLETCGQAMALEHNGDVYSCDHFVEPKYLLGNIHNESLARLAGSEQQRKFGNDKRHKLPRYCRECDVRFACHGECPKNRFIQTPDGEPGLNYLCSGYKAFFHHVDRPMKIMAELLRRDRAPAEIMQILSGKSPDRSRQWWGQVATIRARAAAGANSSSVMEQRLKSSKPMRYPAGSPDSFAFSVRQPPAETCVGTRICLVHAHRKLQLPERSL